MASAATWASRAALYVSIDWPTMLLLANAVNCCASEPNQLRTGTMLKLNTSADVVISWANKAVDAA